VLTAWTIAIDSGDFAYGDADNRGALPRARVPRHVSSASRRSAYEYLYLVENGLRFSPARQPEAAPDRDDHGPIGRTADRS
jgi:hypothetical protein